MTGIVQNKVGYSDKPSDLYGDVLPKVCCLRRLGQKFECTGTYLRLVIELLRVLLLKRRQLEAGEMTLNPLSSHTYYYRGSMAGDPLCYRYRGKAIYRYQ